MNIDNAKLCNKFIWKSNIVIRVSFHVKEILLHTTMYLTIAIILQPNSTILRITTFFQDGVTCKSKDKSPAYAIYSSRNELRLINVRNFLIRPLLTNLKNTVALDFYYTREKTFIFWTDVVDDKIYRGRLLEVIQNPIYPQKSHNIFLTKWNSVLKK